MTIEMMKKNNGETTDNGKTYVLTHQANIGGPLDAPYYAAYAICPTDGPDEDGLYPVYSVTWYPSQEWLDSDREDEGWACNWEEADELSATGMGYDLEDDRLI